MITSQNRPGLPVFLRATLKKLGKAWVRGYVYRTLMRDRAKGKTVYYCLLRSCFQEVIEVSVCGIKRGSCYINIAKKLSLKIARSQRSIIIIYYYIIIIHNE